MSSKKRKHGDSDAAPAYDDYEAMRRTIRDHRRNTCLPRSALREQSEAFEKEVDDLYELRQELERKERHAKASSVALGKALASSVSIDCYALATSFHGAMPREIRDRVYFFLQSGLPQSDTWLHPQLSNRPYWEYPQVSIPHWLSPVIVGVHFARECAQTYYEETTLVLTESNFGDTKGLLETDLFGMDLRPADHIRKVRVVLKGRCVFDRPSSADTCIQIYQVWLSALCALKTASATVVFTMPIQHVHGEVQRLFTLVQYSKILRPLLFDLKERKIGFKVLVGDFQDITHLWNPCVSGPWYNQHSSLYTDDPYWSDYAVMMKRFDGWEKSIYLSYNEAWICTHSPRLDLRQIFTLPDPADYDFLSQILKDEN